MARKTPPRERVLEGARELFLKKGFYGVSTREIAAKAGTSESGVFRHFPSKYELLVGVYEDSWAQLNELVAVPELNDPRVALLAVANRVWSLYDDNPDLLAFIILYSGVTRQALLIDPAFESIVTPNTLDYVRRVGRLCSACVEGGLVDPSYSAASLREGYLALLEGILRGWYLADRTHGAYPARISANDAMTLMQNLVYTSSSSVPNVREHQTRAKRRTPDTLVPNDEAEHARVWSTYKETGGPEELELLVLRYRHVVTGVVEQLGIAEIENLEMADLLAFGLSGLIDAIEKWDYVTRGITGFEAYASARVRMAIIDDLVALGWDPELVHVQAREIRAEVLLPAGLYDWLSN